VDSRNDRIQKFTSDGMFVTKWGSGGGGQFSDPHGIAVDAAGDVYVADSDDHRVRKFRAEASPQPPLLSWAGSSGYQSDGCDPEVGQYPVQTFTFQVRVSDVNGDAPTYCRVVIERDENPWRTFNMRRGARSPATGANYTFARSLPPGDFRYRFEAGDGSGPGVGAPTQWVDGVSVVPRLNQRPDGAVWNGVKWTGDNYYNTNAYKQRVNREIAGGGSIDYTVRVENDSQAADTLVVKGTSGRRDWTITYLAGDGADITSDMTGGGWTTAELAGGAATEITARVAVTNVDYAGAPKTVLVQVGRAVWGPTKYAESADTVKMVTTVEGAASSGAMHVTGLMAVPTSMGAQVQFGLSSAAQVDARVLNIAGRPIKTICTAKACEAGTNTLLWNAMSDGGLRVPNGVYLVDVAARTDDGGQSKALTQVRVGR
jgi:hypothetical protein